jgi:protein-L-isoaspartate(D-aspartate) O-methyltransferase
MRRVTGHRRAVLACGCALAFAAFWGCRPKENAPAEGKTQPENPALQANAPQAEPAPEQAAQEKTEEPPRETPEEGAWRKARFEERQDERRRMVAQQIEARGRDVKDAAVLKAMLRVPRHVFVPAGEQRAAYGDTALPIGHGQTISQPFIVACMTEQLKLKPGDRVLEIGTGSAYQAAVLAEIAPAVYTIEIIDALAREAAERLRKLGYTSVRVKAGDGYFGWPEHAPFDGIIVTCAAGHVPPPLIQQLKPGGRMIIPVGDAFLNQFLVLVTKDPDGRVRSEQLIPVVFVPMTGRARGVR